MVIKVKMMRGMGNKDDGMIRWDWKRMIRWDWRRLWPWGYFRVPWGYFQGCRAL